MAVVAAVDSGAAVVVVALIGAFLHHDSYFKAAVPVWRPVLLTAFF